MEQYYININGISHYDLGIIWAVGSYNENGRFSFRHKEKHFINRLNGYFTNTIYQQKRSKNKIDEQYVLKTKNLNVYDLYNIGWSERNSDIRDIPNLPNLSDYKDFLRAYIELHSTLDYSTRHKNNGDKYKALRLRIYGNTNLMDSVNKLLSREVRVGIKTIQTLSNHKTSIIYYTSFLEIQNIFNYLYGEPNFNNFWEDINCKLKVPTKEY